MKMSGELLRGVVEGEVSEGGKAKGGKVEDIVSISPIGFQFSQ